MTAQERCTRAEREVLEMIKAWPGVPAIVLFTEEGGWSVSTAPEHVPPKRAPKARSTTRSTNGDYGMKPRSKPPAEIHHEGKTWIEIGQAARLSRTKAVLIKEEIARGRITAHELEGRLFIPLADANRLKREAGVMLSVRRMGKKPKLPPANAFGVLAKESMTWVPGLLEGSTKGRKTRD